MNVATERIERLHELAREAAREGDADLARRYVRRARRVAERNR
ncbi:ribonuclease P, partial [Halobacteriales archaeon SW_5_68_122]